MNYVMSDLHGNYKKYRDMLELIGFSEEDMLYINGDICDRGKDSAKIYMDVMSRDNVFVIKGNHEVMAEEHLEYLVDKNKICSINILDLLSERDLWGWLENGGDTTIISLFNEKEKTINEIFEFIKSLPYYKTVEINDKRYILVHGGLGEYKKGDKLEEIDPQELVWSQPDFDGEYFEDENTYLIVGHTPTFILRHPEQEVPGTIYRGKGNVIAIDCGAAYPEYLGRLGCLCLDTGEEFYL